MEFSKYSYRQAEIILNSKFMLKEEITKTLNSLSIRHGERETRRGSIDPHKIIQHAFIKKGWSDEFLISAKTKKKQYFDLYKNRVALEIEFSRSENLYRDYLRFILAHNEDKIDVGVIITLDRKVKTKYKYSAVRPDIQYAIDDLTWLRPILGVPIWVIGLY